MKLICIGRNYADHSKELGNAVPSEPVFFLKPETAVVYPGKELKLPTSLGTIHHELEVVVAIDGYGKDIPAQMALGFVGWYTLGLDLTARTVQDELKAKGLPWEKAKAFDGSAVIGDVALPLAAGMDLLTHTIELKRNGQWTNISDGYFTTGSVGAIAVSESDPNIVYVGMGEHAVRGVMTHHGDGVYKSTDAGKTWKKIGLELTQHISRISIHPKNHDIVFVAAQGALYGSSQERGIYRSQDGGKKWNKVLYVDEKTGCAELSMDMNNPLVLYAAMWEHGRLPWKVISGGPGSGLYKSTDGGTTWDKMKEGLPTEMGKMAIAVCRSNSDRVYALIEGKPVPSWPGAQCACAACSAWGQSAHSPFNTAQSARPPRGARWSNGERTPVPGHQGPARLWGSPSSMVELQRGARTFFISSSPAHASSRSCACGPG